MEVASFGWNLGTFVAVVVLGFALWQAWGLRKQYQSIVRLGHAKVVSVTKFGSATVFFFLSGIYGHSIGSVVLPLTALILVVMSLPVMYALHYYEGYTVREKRWLSLFASTIPVMTIAPQQFKATLFLVFAFARMIPFASQPVEMYREKKVGAIDIRLFWAYLTGAFFWVTFYFIVLSDWILRILSVMNTSILLITVILYYRYREEPKV